ncbi:hypothetical protein K1719_010898 [Acacia pycnantha]|nr:hypothetical protein K1719_010898 [Acacia pycnantha]
MARVKRKLDDDNKLKPKWYTEYSLDNDLTWSLALNRENRTMCCSELEIQLLDTKRFGKALVVDGEMRCAEKDEFVYHECLIHPALLCHPHPKTVFIMGGSDGYVAREVLKHKSLERVVLCDIEKEVVTFCREYLEENKEAFYHKKLHIQFNDIKDELEKSDEKFDIIVGDLADLAVGGATPCYQLYTQSFYEEILKPRLSEKGIFVTQAGPAGISTHKEVFTSIHNTIRQVFKYVKTYTAHVPSYADTWGWVMASDHHPLSVEDGEMDKRIEERIDEELRFLNEAWFISSTTMNKTVSQSLLNETYVYTEEVIRFVHGQGIANQD